MKKLVGLVLVKEQNIGVPQLVVEVYDVRDATSVQFDPGQPLGRIGRRLGSALTDADGRFVFSADDLEFQGNEARPNLVVAVLAPEDVRSVDDPVPLLPEQRVLFLSAAPRLDAGADEAFVIRLLAAQLKRYGITTQDATGANQRDARFADAVESSWATSSYLADRFKPKIEEQLRAATERRAKAKTAIANLSAIPRHLRDSKDGTPNKFQNNSYLIGDRRQLPDQLQTLQEKALTDGLNRLSAASPPVMRVYVDRSELKGLGLQVDKNNVVTGSVDGQALRSIARQTMNGFDLVRRRGHDNPSPDELRRRYLTPFDAVTALKLPLAPKVKTNSDKPRRQTKSRTSKS